MPRDERKRQQKLMRHAAKRKEHAKGLRSAAEATGHISEARQMDMALSAPVSECLMLEKLFRTGIGHVVFTRELPNGHVAVAAFLLDVFCLGVKNALFKVVPPYDYTALLQGFAQHGTLRKIDPACARKLVEEAEAYARDLGFSPHPDYLLSRKIFGDVDPSTCRTHFEFGKDGKPFYSSGPYDTPAKSKRIIDTLRQRFGPDGFHYMVGLGDTFSPGGEADLDALDEFDEDADDA